MDKTIEQKYKQIKKKLSITDSDVSLMFGYSSVHSFRNATRRNQIVKGIVELSKLFELREDKEG
jgi:hypothetical protein